MRALKLSPKHEESANHATPLLEELSRQAVICTSDLEEDQTE